jgi:hypothetical protein
MVFNTGVLHKKTVELPVQEKENCKSNSVACLDATHCRLHKTCTTYLDYQRLIHFLRLADDYLLHFEIDGIHKYRPPESIPIIVDIRS